MALHRDILWIGRQWAVTGHGMQLIDQRLEGAFDIEVTRLWDDDLVETLRAKAWLKADDFEKGLAVARTRYPEGSTPAVATPVLVIEPIAPPPPPEPEPPAPIELSPPAPPEVVDTPPPHELPPQGLPHLQMKIDGGAKFARPWRVWMKKT
jgi:hypothetical protein